MFQRVAILVCLSISQCFAGEWEITPRTSFTEEYSDNVTLSDQNTLSDFITTLTPGVTIRGRSARLEMNVDYNMQNLLYADNDQFNDTNHQLQSRALLNVVEDIIFLEARANQSQQNSSATQGFTPSNRSQTGNRTDVLYYEFIPQMRQHLGNWADFNGSYGFAENENSAGTQGALGSSSEETLTLGLTSGSRLAKTPISISYSDREEMFDSGRENRVKNFFTNLSYIYSRKLRLTAEFGFDDNQFQGGGNGRDGFRWKLGGTLTPSPRTRLSGHFGKRGFGDTFDVSASHRHRRLNFALNYREELQTQAQRQRDLVLVPLSDLSGQPITNLNTSSNFLTPLNTPSITEEVSLSKNLNVNLSYQLRRSTINASYFQTERIFQSSLQGEDTRGASISFQHTLRPRLSATMSLSWRESESLNGDVLTNNPNNTDTELLQISPSLNYQVGPHLDFSLSYQYIDSNGNSVQRNVFSNGNGGFLENALTANFILHN